MKNRLLIAFVGLFLAIPSQASLIGVEWGGSVVDIDPSTGSGSALGGSGFFGLNGAASNSGGDIFTISGGLGAGTLLTIDATTGAGTVVTATADGTLNGARGLAFSAADNLFAIYDTAPPGGVGMDDLYTVNTSTGLLSLVGSTGRNDLQGLAFAPDGTLFAWDIFSGLVTIDAGTGASTLIGGGGAGNIQALEFASDGTLYGGGSALYTINTTTGARSMVGSGGYSDVRGLAFTNAAAVPVAGSLSLLCAGLIGFGFTKRRRD